MQCSVNRTYNSLPLVHGGSDNSWMMCCVWSTTRQAAQMSCSKWPLCAWTHALSLLYTPLVDCIIHLAVILAQFWQLSTAHLSEWALF